MQQDIPIWPNKHLSQIQTALHALTESKNDIDLVLCRRLKLLRMYLWTRGMFSLKLPDQRKFGYPGTQTSEKATREASF